jgi:hypothetical protein
MRCALTAIASADEGRLFIGAHVKTRETDIHAAAPLVILEQQIPPIHF